MTDKTKNGDEDSTVEKAAVTLPGTVEKIIPPITPGQPEKAQIVVEGAEHLYKEIRVENALQDESGNEVTLKEGARVEVTIEADPEAIKPKGQINGIDPLPLTAPNGVPGPESETTEQFDIFHRDSDGGMAWRWLQVASTIEDAKEQVRKMSALKPGEYMIFDQAREIKTFINARAKANSGSGSVAKPG